KSGGGPHHQRGTDREKKITVKSELLGTAHFALGHRLAEGNRRGLDMAAAIAAIRRTLAALDELPAHPGELVALAAAETQSISVVAVQLDHVFRRYSGALMEIVDVLRDHGRRLAGAVEARERKVPAARPGGGKLCVHGEAPPPGLVAHLLAGKELVEGDWLG